MSRDWTQSPGQNAGYAVEALPPRQDAWFLRLLATACAFTVFGLGGLFLRIAVFPSQRLLYGDGVLRRHKARNVIFRTFRLFIRFLVRTGVLTYQFDGVERLGLPGQMIVANHPSLLDVVFLLAHVPAANCIVKHGLVKNPFTRGPVCNAGYITNDASIEMFEAAAQCLRDGETLLVFPEGTRTPADKSPEFHRGACAIAMRGARVITPVVIRMNVRSLTKGEPWYRIPRRRMHYTFTVGDDIDPARWTSQHPFPIAGRKMNQHLHTYFEAELGRDESVGA
jgi:1-acyl-sn-glycerol-3-phosphate acyltransferase